MEHAPAQTSLLKFYLDSLGLQYALLLPMAGLAAFALVLALVIRGRGPMAAAALLLAVSLPALVGVYGAIDGVLQSYLVIAASSTAPKASEVAAGWSAALVVTKVALLLMLPSLLVALFGSALRALQARRENG